MKHTGASTNRTLTGQLGFSLLEFLIGMLVLAIGVGGMLPLLIASITLDKKAAHETTSVMVSELVLEQMSAAGANFNGVLPNTLQDCNNPANAWSIDMTSAPVNGGSGGTYGGNGAHLTNQGAIDWTQSYASVPANYKMRYVACSTTTDTPVTYDIRWDVIQTSASNSTKMVIISAKPRRDFGSALGVVAPASLRTIIGM